MNGRDAATLLEPLAPPATFAFVARAETPGAALRTAAWTTRVLDLLVDGAVLVDAERRVHATNAVFRRSVRARGALRVRNRLLEAVHAGRDADLAERVATAIASGRERVLRVPVADSGEPLELRISPAGDGELAVVIVHDPASARAVCVRRLRELYDLTPAQAEVAARLAAGASLEGAAAQLGVSLNTVRTHLQGVFSKCGVSTQAALLQRLALGAARVGVAPAPAAPTEAGHAGE